MSIQISPNLMLSNVELPDGSNMAMNRLPVSQKWCSPYIWRRLDQRRIDNKLSIMYTIIHILIAILISYFLIPLVSPSRHYLPVVLQADNCYDWLLQIFNLSKSRISLEQPPPWNCGLLHHGAVQPSSLQDWPRLTIENHYNFKPNLYSYLFNS